MTLHEYIAQQLIRGTTRKFKRLFDEYQQAQREQSAQQPPQAQPRK